MAGRVARTAVENGTPVSTPRQECDALVAAARAADAAAGGDTEDPEWAATSRGCVFDTLPSTSPAASAARAGDAAAVAAARSSPPLSPAGAAIALGPRLAAAAAALLGTRRVQVVLVGDQFIAKPPRSVPASSFGAHADADALPGGRSGAGGRSCVSIWMALDDVCGANGGLILPALAAEGSGGSASLPVPLTAPAGTAVAMRGDFIHSSSANSSGLWRRAYMPQYGDPGVELGAGWAVRVPASGV